MHIYCLENDLHGYFKTWNMFYDIFQNWVCSPIGLLSVIFVERNAYPSTTLCNVMAQTLVSPKCGTLMKLVDRHTKWDMPQCANVLSIKSMRALLQGLLSCVVGKPQNIYFLFVSTYKLTLNVFSNWWIDKTKTYIQAIPK